MLSVTKAASLLNFGGNFGGVGVDFANIVGASFVQIYASGNRKLFAKPAPTIHIDRTGHKIILYFASNFNRNDIIPTEFVVWLNFLQQGL